MDAALNTTTLIRQFPSPSLAAIKHEKNCSESEELLWHAFTQGSREALNSIFDSHVHTLYAYGSGITKDKDLVADCIQDLFFELWSKRESLANDVKLVKFYLIKSLRRKLLRQLVGNERFWKKKSSENYIDETECSVEVSLIEEETANVRVKDINQAIAKLSPRQQEAVHLKFFENMSYEDIASVMEVDVKAAYNLISKSVLSLRKTLSGLTIR